MNWILKIAWQVVPYVVLVPLALLVVAVARKVYLRLRWRRQLVKEIAIGGPSALLAPIYTPASFFAKSVAVSFPDWGGFVGDVELFSGEEAVARIQIPWRRPAAWDVFIPTFFKVWRGAVETKVEKVIEAGELIARIDGNSRRPRRESRGDERHEQEIILKISVYGKGLESVAGC
jgi:hypothetical protein